MLSTNYNTVAGTNERKRRLMFDYQGGGSADTSGMVSPRLPDTFGARSGPPKPAAVPVGGPTANQLGQPLTQPAQSMAGGSTGAPTTPTAPAAPVDTTPDNGGAAGGDGSYGQYNAKGKPLGVRPLQKQAARMYFANAAYANPYLRGLFQNALNAANDDRFSDEGRAAFLGQRNEAIHSGADRARAALAQDNYARGISDSSYDTLGRAGIAAAERNAVAGNVSSLYGAEEGRQLQMQQMAQALGAQLSGQGQVAANIAGNVVNQQFAQSQFDAQQGDFWSDIASVLSGGAQLYFAGGGQPWAPKPPR